MPRKKKAATISDDDDYDELEELENFMKRTSDRNRSNLSQIKRWVNLL